MWRIYRKAKNLENYNKLDAAAKLFPSVRSKNNSSVYRLSVVLNEEVDKKILQLAVNMIYERYSLFFLRLRRGFFWHYFDKNHIHFTVAKEKKSPCNDILSFENKGYIIKVLYYKNRISIEAFHSITDGSGVVEYLKSLVYYYLCIKHGNVDHQGKILLFNETDTNDGDSFIEHFGNAQIKRKKQKNDISSKNSFLIKGKHFRRKGNSVITGIVSVNELKRYCKQKNCSITAFLTANMIMSIYVNMQKNSADKKPIVIAVPVNLRKLFDSKTLKNFFGVISVGCSMSDDITFEKLLDIVSEQLKSAGDQEHLIDSSVKKLNISKNVFSRYTPLIFKNLIVPIGYNFIDDIKKTMSISNLGPISFPDGVKKYIEHTEIFLYPTAKKPINCGICSFEDKLSVNFTRNIKDSGLMKEFFSSIVKITGVSVSVYSNMWGDDYE